MPTLATFDHRHNPALFKGARSAGDRRRSHALLAPLPGCRSTLPFPPRMEEITTRFRNLGRSGN